MAELPFSLSWSVLSWVWLSHRMSASHTVELMGLLQSAWPPYALLPLELDRQLRRYCNGNRKLLGTSGLSLEAKQLRNWWQCMFCFYNRIAAVWCLNNAFNNTQHPPPLSCCELSAIILPVLKNLLPREVLRASLTILTYAAAEQPQTSNLIESTVCNRDEMWLYHSSNCNSSNCK